jgi:hypothetical protein
MRRVLDRGARVAWAFVTMNAAAVVGLVRLVVGREVWR